MRIQVDPNQPIGWGMEADAAAYLRRIAGIRVDDGGRWRGRSITRRPIGC